MSVCAYQNVDTRQVGCQRRRIHALTDNDLLQPAARVPDSGTATPGAHQRFTIGGSGLHPTDVSAGARQDDAHEMGFPRVLRACPPCRGRCAECGAATRDARAAATGNHWLSLTLRVSSSEVSARDKGDAAVAASIQRQARPVREDRRTRLPGVSVCDRTRWWCGLRFSPGQEAPPAGAHQAPGNTGTLVSPPEGTVHGGSASMLCGRFVVASHFFSTTGSGFNFLGILAPLKASSAPGSSL